MVLLYGLGWLGYIGCQILTEDGPCASAANAFGLYVYQNINVKGIGNAEVNVSDRTLLRGPQSFDTFQ